jgi:hypothetical protein
VVGQLVAQDADPLRISFDSHATVGDLQVPDDGLLGDVQDTYGSAFRLRLLRQLAGDEHQVVADWEAGPAAFAEALGRLTTSRPAADTVIVRMQLEKDAISEMHAEAGHRRRSFLFWHSFEQVLLGDLASVVNRMWGDDRTSRCHVFVGDESPFCIGPHLVVTGSPPQSEVPTSESRLRLDELARLDSERLDATSWGKEDLVGGLAPDHFLVSACNHTPTAELLAGHLLWLTVASLADRSANEGGEESGRFGRFEGSTGFVEIRVPQRMRIDAEAQQELVSAVHWVYAPGPEGVSVVGQRLGPLQARVAEVLGSVRSEDRAVELTRLMPEVLSASQWRWRHALSQEAAQSLEQEIDAIEKAEAAAQGFIDETRSISEDVASVVRGAAVTIVTAFVAAALEPDLTTLAIRSAGMAYAGLVLFLWLTSTVQSRRRINHKWNSYQDARIKRARLIGPERLDQVETSSVAQEEQRARRHLWVASLAYVSFIVASLAFGIWGPQLIDGASEEQPATSGSETQSEGSP